MLIQLRVIARGTLKLFVLERVESSLRVVVDTPLGDWYGRTLNAEWKNSAELKLDFRSANTATA